MDDREREMWVDNDEGLYDMWRSSGQSKRAFVRENRAFLDNAIGQVVGGTKRPHYLKYDSGRYRRGRPGGARDAAAFARAEAARLTRRVRRGRRGGRMAGR